MAAPTADKPFLLHVEDYLRDTTALQAEEHGAYLLLLMEGWRRGGKIQNDQTYLRRVACVSARRWPQVWGLIAHYFTQDGQSLVQRRLSREVEAVSTKAAATSAARRAAGAAGAAARWRPTVDGNAPAAKPAKPHKRTMANVWQTDSNCHGPLPLPLVPPSHSPSYSPSPSPSLGEADLRTGGDLPIGRHVDPARPPLPPGVWSAYDWYRRFQTAWCQAKGEARYRDRGEQDARAMRKLTDVIRDTPPQAILAAQARADAMFGMFFGETGRPAENVHPFAFYVARFDDYRVRAKPAVVAERARSRQSTVDELPPLPPPGRPK